MSEIRKNPIRIHKIASIEEPVSTQMIQSPKHRIWPWISVVMFLALGLAFMGWLYLERLKPRTDNPVVEKYQAIFLTNGQVYFGKITKETNNYLVLREIYYLQVTQPSLQGSADQKQQQFAQKQEPQISLVKLGNELHGPEDEMFISRSQLLFYENLKENSQVVKAIRDYKITPQR